MKPQPYKRRKAVQPVAAPLSRVTRRAFGRRGFAEGEIIRDWSLIAGELLAAHTLPEKISFPPGSRKGGTLHLRVGLPGLATEIQHLKPQLIDSINRYFGYRAVDRLTLVQAPVRLPDKPNAPVTRALTPAEEQSLLENLDGITDPELRLALQRLGQAVIGRLPQADAEKPDK